MVLTVNLRWVRDELCLLGRKISIFTGLLLFAIIGLIFSRPNKFSWDRMEWSYLQVFSTCVFFSEFFVSLVVLLLRLVDVMFDLMGRRLDIGIRVAITVFTLGFALIFINRPPSTLFQHDIATLIYVIGQFLFFLSLMLEQTQKKELSHLFAGMAYVCLHLALLGYSLSRIPGAYDWAGVAILFFIVLFALLGDD